MTDEIVDPFQTPAPKKRGRKPKGESTEVAELRAQIAEMKLLLSLKATQAAQGMTREDFLAAMDRQAEHQRQAREQEREIEAEVNAKAMKKALMPENPVDPGISVYNPLGEVAHPRPKPTHTYMLGPFPIAMPGDYNTVTRTEIEFLNALVPGEYTVTKADGHPVKCTVETKFLADRVTPEKTTLHIPIANDEERMNWPPLLQVLTEIVTGEPAAASFAKLQNRIAELERQLAASAA